MIKLRDKLVMTLTNAFPHATIRLQVSGEDITRVFISYNHGTTTFIPSPGVMDMEYTEEVMAQLIKTIQELPTQVNARYEEPTKEENRSI